VRYSGKQQKQLDTAYSYRIRTRTTLKTEAAELYHRIAELVGEWVAAL